ncbi:Uncharacterised protein (plasmid) [Tsukamurella tyrosinosolvens]|uniref:Uncharacterized protein n=1 Tax=Tsukamurella tyrosinosolvens TaxID=57704 RepID=A0A1H4VAW4_TSUTY|nr:hypothetical protein [Tsukamurella tyrosinosolvens]KXO91018.1 hypothetical protein AXK58_21550 [Tsukamurella tyrosinosolvens]SEC77738.1 hypothetical protein SAMN04489793_3180 [Tsukamurella tyrosinosolvens]VEH90614.1 Uncharacterised protein [Tsukamurella tyrosinosolvens]
MSNSSEVPYLTRELSDDPGRVNMTRVRADFHLSDQRALYLSEQDAWAFPLGNDTEALHLFGPLYQAAGTAEKFAIVGELENFTTGAKYVGYADPGDISAWIKATTLFEA